MATPDLTRIPPYYHNYVLNVKEHDINAAFDNSFNTTMDFFSNIPADKHDYQYAPGKWTLREMLQHILDAERVFVYRALCFARKEQISLPGFDENVYADNSKASARNWDELLEEFRLVRLSTAIMFRSFDGEQLNSAGIANEKSVYVEAIGYVIIGHAVHHINIIKERYL